MSNTHTNVTGRVSFRMAEGDTQIPIMEQRLLEPTGIDHAAGVISNIALYYSQSRVTGNRRAWVEDVQTLYIYSDAIDYQIMGNTKPMMMGVYAVKGTHVEQQSVQFNPIQNRDITTSTILSITMRICTPTGEEDPLVNGHTLSPTLPKQDAIK